MSRDFIGSKIAIITKSQCRYVGTIIGIDAQTSSIVLGSAKCCGTENRTGYIANGHKPGQILPIVQFANSDIEDLKIVDEEQTPETAKQSSQSMSTGSSQQPSIHDDPAIVSAVVGAGNKVNASNTSLSNRLIHNLQHMSLSDEQSNKVPKNEGEMGTPWSLLSSSEWERNNSSKPSSHQQSDNKSKFFDDFISNNRTNQSQFHRSYQRSSNTHSTQTSRENGNNYNGRYDDNSLPERQAFFSDDRPYPPQRQQNRYQNGYQNGYQNDYQQRNFYNNRRPQMFNQQRRGGGGGGGNVRGGGGGGNRETFQNNPNDYDNDFDFETSNQKFNKLTNDDEETQQNESALKAQVETDHSISYDKKKSFFDSLVINEPSDSSASRMNNRSKNSDTFGSDAYQRFNPRSNGNGYRRPNNNYRQHNNNNGYQYRY